jgi:hypothetical protein
MRTRQTTTTPSAVPEAFDRRTDERLEFWRQVAETFGISDAAVDEALVGLEPLTVFDLLLPGRSDEERSEVMWALGEFERRSQAADQNTAVDACAGVACAGVCQPAA